MTWSRKRIFRAIIKLRTSPRAISLGASVGVFCAFSPLLGLQMIIAAFLATIIGGNRPVAVAMTWIANPLTVVPIIVLIHRVGRYVLGITSKSNAVARCLPLLEEHSFVNYKVFVQKTVAASGPAAAALLMGWLVCGLACAVIAYPIVLWAVKALKERGQRCRADRNALKET